MAVNVVDSISYRTGQFSESVKSITYSQVSVPDKSDYELLETELNEKLVIELKKVQEQIDFLKKVCEDMHRENVELRAFFGQGLDQRLKKEQEVLYETYNDLAVFFSNNWKIAVRNFFRNPSMYIKQLFRKKYGK